MGREGGREGGHSISTEVTQPVVALVTYLLGRRLGWGWGEVGWRVTGVANSKHWFATSFLRPLPYLVTS